MVRREGEEKSEDGEDGNARREREECGEESGVNVKDKIARIT